MTEYLSFEKLSWAVRLLVVQGLTLFLLLLNSISFSLPFTGDVRPFFVLMAIYYWAIYRPTLIPPAMVFVIGVLLDFLAGFPIGLHAILLLVVQWAVRDQRVFLMGQPYVMVWIGFVLVCSLFSCAEWLFFWSYAGVMAPLKVVAGNIVLSILFFPLVTLLFIVTHRILPVASKTLH